MNPAHMDKRAPARTALQDGADGWPQPAEKPVPWDYPGAGFSIAHLILPCIMGIVKENMEVNFMSDTYFDLASRLEDTFSEIENDILADFKSNNKEYAKLKNRISEMKQQHPFIASVLDGSGEIHLTAEEHKVLAEYLHLKFEQEDMERLQIYFRGHTDAFAYLKKIKML